MKTKKYEALEKAVAKTAGARIVKSEFIGPLGSREVFTVEVNGVEARLPYRPACSVAEFVRLLSLVR